MFQTRTGFTLIDTAVTVAAIGVLGALATAGMSGARSGANLSICTARLGALGAGSVQFAGAHNGLFVGFTWQQGGNNSQWPDLNAQQAQGPVQAHTAQALDIIRRRGLPNMYPDPLWMADPQYFLLPLADFQNRPLSEPVDICPLDDLQNKWRRHPERFGHSPFPVGNIPNPGRFRYMYRSSYTQSGAAFDENQSVLTPAAAPNRIEHAGQHNFYLVSGVINPGPSSMSLVAFPSAKAHMFDTADRHFAPRPMFFGYADARGPVLFFDGSVRVERSGDAVTPWSPRQPKAPTGQIYTYAPSAWEPPTLNGQLTEELEDQYRWTRDGLLGRDFQN